MPTAQRCTIVPPYLLLHLTQDANPRVARCAQRTIDHDITVRERRTIRSERSGRDPKGLVPPDLVRRARGLESGRRPQVTAVAPAVPQRAVHDAEHGTDLPGRLVRAEGAEPVDDVAVNEAYDGLGATWQLLWTAFKRDSLDGKGLPLGATVHYDEDYDNAFWDGAQMVFGDGDGVYFDGFTSSVDVIGHELTHGMTQYTAGFTYVAQSGALNESVSDVFGSLVKQHQRGQKAQDADWLVGEGLFTDRVNGVALRSMKAPGTAYDDPHLGKDPQPADMDGYVDLPHDSEHDNGGVHTNSGIPNRAFYLAATAIGGYAWEGAGLVWYDTITAKGVPKDVDFAGFAELTIAAAGRRFGAGSTREGAVRQAWATVRVL
jgi:Zn-dependent metalloprotease